MSSEGGKDDGPNKIRRVTRRRVTSLACHTIGSVKEVSWARGRGVFGTETQYHRGRWDGRQMLVNARWEPEVRR